MLAGFRKRIPFVPFVAMEVRSMFGQYNRLEETLQTSSVSRNSILLSQVTLSEDRSAPAPDAEAAKETASCFRPVWLSATCPTRVERQQDSLMDFPRHLPSQIA